MTMAIDSNSVLVQSLAQPDLVDEYSRLAYLVPLGSGEKLIADGERLNLHLIDSRAFPSGVVLMRSAAERGS
jgi:hypothetical protein